MTARIPDHFETIAPTAADSQLAKESSRLLAERKLGRRNSVRIQLSDDGRSDASITVPAAAMRLLLHVLQEMSEGHSITLVPTHAELTTQQAADLLHVSRPYLAKLLDEKKIPSRMVGKYRRVRFDDLMAYKHKDDQARAQVIDQLTAEAQELGLGY